MIYPVTMYAAKCDGCGKEANLMGEYAALADKETVLEDLIMSDYHVDGDKHYCPDCWSYDDEDNIVIKLKPSPHDPDTYRPTPEIANDEILNIDYHRRLLIVKALNRMPTKIRAAMALGIPERTLYTLIRQYSIIMNKSGMYFCDDQNSN